MRIEELPFPGNFKASLQLRQGMVKAISFVEVAAAYRTDGTPPQSAVDLLNFLEASAAHVRKMVPKEYRLKPASTSGSFTLNGDNQDESCRTA